jgi:hypothetical protein
MSWVIVTKTIEKESAALRKFSYTIRTHTGELVELIKAGKTEGMTA